MALVGFARLHPVALPTCPEAADNMSLLKPITMSPARLAANRRNAQKCTGPRTRRGKAQSRLNGLRSGRYSRHYHNLMNALLHAPPGAVDKMAQAVLTQQQAAHPLFAEFVEVACQAESGKPFISPKMQREQEKLLDAIRAMFPPLPRWLRSTEPS